MALEGYWLGQPRQGLAHGQQAIALLERTSERLALGMAYVYTSINHTLMGDFGAALDAVARARGHGAVIGDPSLQSYVTWLTGWIQAMRGEWEQSIATCQHCLERSPHPLHTALALSTLGYAYVETHQPQQALPLLEQAAEYMRQFQHRPLHGWAITLLAEAQRLQGHLGLAYDLARQGLSLTSEAAYRLGIGMAQRALGRIAQANHDLIAAETSCTQALATFAAIPAHYELARTHLDLAAFAHAQKQPATTIHHLHEAHARFASLHIPVYMARTMALAEACGVPLPAP
jgi:tetratricopeptide (TPR) repeat protein